MVQVAKKITPNVPHNRWIVSLDNGETIFEDIIEGKPVAWERLKEYLKDNDLRITQLRHQITNRRQNPGNTTLKKNADGYVALKKIGVNDQGNVTRSYGIGYIESGKAYIIWQTDDRTSYPEIRSIEKCGFGAIINE